MHDIDERLCQLFFQVLYLFRLPLLRLHQVDGPDTEQALYVHDDLFRCRRGQPPRAGIVAAAPPSSRCVLVIGLAANGRVSLESGSLPYWSGVKPATRRMFSAASAEPPKVCRSDEKNFTSVVCASLRCAMLSIRCASVAFCPSARCFHSPFSSCSNPPGPELVKVEPSLTHQLMRIGGTRYGIPISGGGTHNLRNGLRVHVPGIVVCAGGNRFRPVPDIIHIDALPSCIRHKDLSRSFSCCPKRSFTVLRKASTSNTVPIFPNSAYAASIRVWLSRLARVTSASLMSS